MKRMGWVIRLNSDSVEKYQRLHERVWPEVLEMISNSNIKNYVIYLREPENLLFASYEYHGSDHDADMASMARDPKTREWWELTDPCQEPLSSTAEGERWAPMYEVFYHA